jgi:tetratricopeptide (TPR) repeat protein
VYDTDIGVYMTEHSAPRAAHPHIELPDAPIDLNGEVKAWRQPVDILTYAPEPADRNPMFLEKRVYQGSSGRVYPLPFIDRISTEPAMKQWQAIHIENEYIRIMILPELGGRIHVGLDKTTGYDFFYRQNVIKPALVGLAGPWISGGVEFNWPQHHRPATFMPVQTELEHDEDGSVTVWCSDHDPMLRMKGMHGICLRPGHAVLEVKVRLFNRTQFTQTFLWWANVAVQVHERYQSFFPPDVRSVADHAKRAITTFPHSKQSYYGIDYPGRAQQGVPQEEVPKWYVPDGSYAPDDLSWYANIPVPTSYMVTKTEGDFSGGYDHRADAGVVHVANHHIAPGKKQWTWGNHDFGYAWDRSLTDHDGPYIELMAGVYTDNQPDFSWLAPWETKTFTQFWYPLHKIGIPKATNVQAALSFDCVGRAFSIGLYVTTNVGEATISLHAGELQVDRWTVNVDIRHPFTLSGELPEDVDDQLLSVLVEAEGELIISYDNCTKAEVQSSIVAVEPLSPAEIGTNEELYLTGLHLQQYHHATRLPELYWTEAVKRDPHDSRANSALGLWYTRRGEFTTARLHFKAAIASLTQLNPNPADGEAYYYLGIAERFLKNEKQAYDALYKATWSAAWRSPAFLALSEIDACRKNWRRALEHVQRSLIAESENLLARNLLVTILLELGEYERADVVHREIRRLDPLDLGSRLRDGIAPADGQERLDLAFDLLRSGQRIEAARVLQSQRPEETVGTLPLELFTLAQIQEELGDEAAAHATREKASSTSVAYCFPFRLEELCVLETARAAQPELVSPHYLLGNFLYDRRRHEEAIREWEIAASLDPEFSTVWRNLGIGLFNVRGDRIGAKAAFDRAFEADGSDARVFYERDQLWKRIGEHPQRRLDELQQHLNLVNMRDDLSVEMATLLNHVGRSSEALKLMKQRHFQPWEGGEGLVLAQYTRACILLGQGELQDGDGRTALHYFHMANDPPANLSEAKHLLANDSDISYWLGVAYEALGDHVQAQEWWRRAAKTRGDFQQMSLRLISDMTYWSALALQRLGAEEDAADLLKLIYKYSFELEVTQPVIDYFATSLPTMLLFEEDLAQRNLIDALLLRAQALMGMSRDSEAREILKQLLQLDNSHAKATDLLRIKHSFDHVKSSC